jgi:hypothetical protein
LSLLPPAYEPGARRCSQKSNDDRDCRESRKEDQLEKTQLEKTMSRQLGVLVLTIDPSGCATTMDPQHQASLETWVGSDHR